MRHPLVIGNWKLNGSKDMINNLVVLLKNELSNVIGCDVAIAPPVIYLDLVKYHLSDSQISLVAQNVDTHLSGAYTGEVSAEMLKDIGVKYTIIGHSECRIYHKENDEFIAKKFAILKKTGLIPVLCIGENEAENEAGQTEAICAHQIDVIINNFGVKAFKNAVIAYEPVWAIGTGKSATPAQAQEVIHKFIRSYIAKYDVVISEQMIILYGGSVNASNSFNLLTQPDIDGALVGGASLKADAFKMIIKIAAEAKRAL